MGGNVGSPPPDGLGECWLEASGRVFCASVDRGSPEAEATLVTVFDDRTVLALATNYYTPDICAVFADGSVACATLDLSAGTAAMGVGAPAHSAMIGCGAEQAPYPAIADVVVLTPVQPPPVSPDASVLSTVVSNDGG